MHITIRTNALIIVRLLLRHTHSGDCLCGASLPADMIPLASSPVQSAVHQRSSSLSTGTCRPSKRTCLVFSFQSLLGAEPPDFNCKIDSRLHCPRVWFQRRCLSIDTFLCLIFSPHRRLSLTAALCHLLFLFHVCLREVTETWFV